MPQFIDVCHALWAEDNLRINPFANLDSVRVTPEASMTTPAPKQKITAEENQANVSLLAGFMGNVKGQKPSLGGRRR